MLVANSSDCFLAQEGDKLILIAKNPDETYTIITTFGSNSVSMTIPKSVILEDLKTFIEVQNVNK